MKKCGNRTFSLFSGKVEFPLKSAIFSKMLIFMKNDIPNLWKRLVILGISDMDGKLTFYVKKLNFKLKVWNFQRNVKFSEYFLFSVIFQYFQTYRSRKSAISAFFTKKAIISLKWLKYWKFHENGGNVVKSAAFPPMSKIPSITKRFYMYFRYISRKYLKFGDFLEF